MILRRSAGQNRGLTLGRLSLTISPVRLQMIEMFKIQFVYGQREIFLKYMNLDQTTLFLGIIQHGFSTESIVTDAMTPRLRNFKRSPYYVYSENTAISYQEQGYRNVIPIGSAWLYLPEGSDLTKRTLNSDRYIVFPIHTSLSVATLLSEEEIRTKIKYWKEIAGKSPLTVCLYWSDYLELSWRKIAHEEEIEVTVVGIGETIPVWSPRLARLDFLANFRNLLLLNTHAIFETYSSAMFYSIATGLSVGYFPQTQTEYELNSVLHRKNNIWMSREIPGKVGEFVSAIDLSDLNRIIMGNASKRSPSELRDLMLYKDGIVPIA